MQLLKKIQLFQFIIIIFFYILSNNNYDYDKIDSNNDYYHFLVKMVKYHKITNKIIKKKGEIIEFKDDYNFLLENNDYFYIFYSNNVYVYFFKMIDSDKHHIYFNGINNSKDLKLIIKTVFEIINQNFNYDNINKLLNNDGKLYKIYNNTIIKMKKEYTIMDVFEMLYDNIYNVDSPSNINLQIDGYSIGGPESQLFAILLLEKYDKLNISMNNIESWFGGNQTIYNNLINNIKLLNIYNGNSIFYFFNRFCQSYFKTDYLFLKKNDKYDDQEVFNYGIKVFPLGIYNYIIDTHVLSKFLK
jgi:hypothetical protein